MKQLLTFIIPLLMYTGLSKDLAGYRKAMDAAVDDSKVAEEMYVDFKRFPENGQAILVGYRAISEILMSKHVFNPISKVSYFRRGKRLLEKAITSEPENTELIFLRYTTQVSVPPLLNYSGNLEADEQSLLSYLKNMSSKSSDQDLYNRIKIYMLQSERLSAIEKNTIKNLP